MQDDILSDWLHGVGEFVLHLRPELLAFLLRLSLALALPALFCFLSFRQGSRSVFLQVSWCAVGLLIAGFLPLQFLTFDGKILRFLVLIGSALCLWFLPRLLTQLLVPELGRQQRVTNAIYLVEAVLIVLQIFMKGGHG
jgi:hypothetical protein